MLINVSVVDKILQIFRRNCHTNMQSTIVENTTHNEVAYVIDALQVSEHFDLGRSEVHEASFNAVLLTVVPEYVRTTYHLRIHAVLIPL